MPVLHLAAICVFYNCSSRVLDLMLLCRPIVVAAAGRERQALGGRGARCAAIHRETYIQVGGLTWLQ
jgi:hypothetical protein